MLIEETKYIRTRVRDVGILMVTFQSKISHVWDMVQVTAAQKAGSVSPMVSVMSQTPRISANIAAQRLMVGVPARIARTFAGKVCTPRNSMRFS